MASTVKLMLVICPSSPGKHESDRINFVCVWTKLDLYWHFDSTSEKVIKSPKLGNYA